MTKIMAIAASMVFVLSACSSASLLPTPSSVVVVTTPHPTPEPTATPKPTMSEAEVTGGFIARLFTVLDKVPGATVEGFPSCVQTGVSSTFYCHYTLLFPDIGMTRDETARVTIDDHGAWNIQPGP